jgi:hypothetical protein
MFQLLDLLKLPGLDHGAVQVHHDYSKIALGQIERIADGTLDPINHDLPATPKDPQRNLPLLAERNFSKKR